MPSPSVIPYMNGRREKRKPVLLDGLFMEGQEVDLNEFQRRAEGADTVEEDTVVFISFVG